MSDTLSQYDTEAAACRQLFVLKNSDYGTSWRILRPSSLTDQIFIKAQRIRTIEETGVNRVGESLRSEYVAIVNYCFMAVMQLTDVATNAQIGYDHAAGQARALMLLKNADYGEAWREMRVSSLTDLILMKLLRVKQIEDNNGQTVVSEGLEANYLDIANYALFALIRLAEAGL